MTDRIDNLTQKIYNEGVVKAKEDADQIIDSAKKEAEGILKAAKQKEAQIIDQAKIDAEEIRKNTDSELKLAARQFLSKLKQHWNPQNPTELDLVVLLPEKHKKELFSFFDSKALDIMNKGIEVEFDSTIESGFKIGPKDGSYIISFSDTDFENYFKNTLKARTRKLLFDEESI